MIGVAALLAFRSFLQLSMSTTQALVIGSAELDFEPEETSSLPQFDGSHVHLQSRYAVTLGSVMGAAIYSMWISLTNILYGMAAERLNDWERCTRTVEVQTSRK